MKHAVLTDGNIRTRFGAHLIGIHADGEDGHVADVVFGRLHTERHDGTVAQCVVGLPVVLVRNTALVAACMGIAHSEVAEERNGGNAIEFVVVPDGIIDTVSGLFVGRHLAKHVGGTHAEIVVLIPIGAGAGTDVGVSALCVGTNHGLAEAGAVVTPVGSEAAVTHGEEGLAFVGEIVHVINGERRVGPTRLTTVGGVVDETDACVDAGVRLVVGLAKEVVDLVELGEPDASGRRSPVPVEGKTVTLDVDQVIVAVGVSPNPLVPKSIQGLELGRKNTSRSSARARKR